jgi:hypothetical protein
LNRHEGLLCPADRACVNRAMPQAIMG